MGPMRKYLLPAVVCAAIGALVVLFVKRGETPRMHDPVTKKEAAARYVLPAAKRDLVGPPTETPTRLDEHKALREMERALAEGNIGQALIYRQAVCSDLDTILANSKLTKDLLDTIRKYGIDSDDLAQRDVVLPILRVLDHPEATKMIGEEYYRAKNEAEQMTLLEAMSKPFHDPKQASVWAVDKALNGTSEETRQCAFDMFEHNAVDPEIISETAMQIFTASTDSRQQQTALTAITTLGDQSPTAREYARRVLKNPRPEDILTIASCITNWGDENDAARLEQLASEYPALGQGLRDQAREVRRRAAMEKTGPHPMEEPPPPPPPPPPEPPADQGETGGK